MCCSIKTCNVPVSISARYHFCKITIANMGSRSGQIKSHELQKCRNGFFRKQMIIVPKEPTNSLDSKPWEYEDSKGTLFSGFERAINNKWRKESPWARNHPIKPFPNSPFTENRGDDCEVLKATKLGDSFRVDKCWQTTQRRGVNRKTHRERETGLWAHIQAVVRLYVPTGLSEETQP